MPRVRRGPRAKSGISERRAGDTRDIEFSVHSLADRLDDLRPLPTEEKFHLSKQKNRVLKLRRCVRFQTTVTIPISAHLPF